jgi:hypothetical protein
LIVLQFGRAELKSSAFFLNHTQKGDVPMNALLRSLATALLGVVCFVGVSQATPALNFTGTTVDWNDGNNYSLGWSFTANQNLFVNSLGVYVAPDFSTGNRIFTQDHAVGIFDANQNLIASATVSNSDALDGFFRYHSLAAPVLLNSGSTYFIAAYMGADQYTLDTTGFSTSSAISYNGSYYSAGNSLTFPATADATTANGYFGPNMDVTPVPEPGTLALFGAGLGMALIVVRRRQYR